MSDKIQILKELHAQGVRIESGLCRYYYAGQDHSEPIIKAAQSFNSRAEHNKEHLVELWDELLKHLTVVPLSFYEGSEVTQRMFINAVRTANRYARRFPRFKHGLQYITRALRMDSKNFSESYMAKFVEYSLCVEWVYCVLRSDLYKAVLLERLHEGEGKAVTAGYYDGGSMGHVDLPMEARVQPLDEMSEDDFEHEGRLHPMYTRKFMRHDIQNGKVLYDFEDRVYRLMNPQRGLDRRDERQPNRSLSRTI